MGERGPERTPTAVLALRNSRLAKRRTRKPTLVPARIKPKRARPIRDLAKIIRELPGYDPFDQAGDCTFDLVAAKKAIRFFECELCHVKGELARTPFYLERWQQAVIGNLFGWKRPDGTRRYRQCLFFVARKNGKTPMAAGIILYTLFEDAEPCAELYGAASEYKQASLVFEHVRGMIAANPDLADRCKVYNGQSKSVQLSSDFSTYRVVASGAGAIHGFNTSCYAIDELHCLPDSELVDALETSTGARRQPLGVFLTTSDYEREGSPCNAKHDYACKVRDGIIEDPSFLPVIYEASVEDDWTVEDTWKKANPNLGVSVSLDYIRSACQKAQDSPRFENTFKRLHLNIRTQQDVRWLPMDRWDACAGEPVNLEDFRGRECWAGLDLAATRDLTALVLAFPEDDGTVALLCVFWIPKDTAYERERRDRVPYLQWIREGWLRTTEGDTTDYATIRRDINELVTEYGIRPQEIAIDRLFQGGQLGQELSEQDGLPVVGHGQGFLSMAAPTKRFEEMILSGEIRHGGNPVLRWHASNVSVELDAAGNMKPSRKKSIEKIDGIVAAIMAVGRCVVRTDTTSVYEERGLLTI
ncbi:MAG: terminase large subunit [Planctomycetes bacterium]|nr:terminase large subunit [Planctomycetota bacterium]